MSFSRPAPEKSFSVARVNRMLGRVYSVALSLVVTEALVNGFSQIEYLNSVIFFLSSFAITSCAFGVLLTQWFFEARTSFWLRATAIVSLFLLATWPLHFESTQSLPAVFQPWIWWLLGISCIAAGTTFRFSFGILFMVMVSATWPVYKYLGFGGSGDLIQTIQETLHLFIFPAIVIAMVLALRWEAAKTDSANQRAITSAVESARVAALEIERSRLDALVHDSVLTTLLVASRATTPQQQELAAKSASEAIQKLQQAKDGLLDTQGLTMGSFFEALLHKVKEHSAIFEVDIDSVGEVYLSPEVSSALSEATLQAVDNSVKHAGSITKAVVRLRGIESGIKIVISDDGKGFRPARVPKDRIGISESISARVRNVGGIVRINSSPGAGTQVVLEWRSHD